METFQEFSNRIKTLTPHLTLGTPGEFFPSKNIDKKVNDNHTFKPYFGDTIVFNLSEEKRNDIESIAKFLYKDFHEYFAEKINPETYHVTLHDLCSGNDLGSIAEKIFHNELKIKNLLKGCQYSHHNIEMQSTSVFNMVGTSIVLGFVPKNETEYMKLKDLKHMFHNIHPLNYPFTPHVTLAYFNKKTISREKKAALYKLLLELSSTVVTLSLSMDNLFYQKFTSMNHYYNIFKIEPSSS